MLPKARPRDKARPRIALLGPYGSGNLGDAAIQEAAIRNLRHLRPNAWIFGIAGNPDDTLERHGIECFPIGPSGKASDAPRGANIRQFGRLLSELWFSCSAWRLMTATDLLVISGGGQIDDYWGGPWAHPFTILRWTLLAKLAGTPVAVASVGSDRLSSRASRVFFRNALRLANYRSFRDKKTLRFVEAELGVRVGNRWVPDLAFSLTTERTEMAKRERSKGPVVVGISPISHAAWTTADDADYESYLAGLRGFVCRLREHDCHVRLFPSQVRMDIAPLQALLPSDSDPSTGRDAVTVNSVVSLQDMLREIDACDIVVAARLHGVLLSILMRKPVIALSYSQKVRTLMDELGCSELCLDLNHVTSDSLHDKLDDVIKRRAEIAALQNKKVNEWGKILERQYCDILALLK